MKEKEIKDKLWDIFLKWHDGQTGAIDPNDGSLIYYDWDVNYFLDKMDRLINKVPVRD